MTMKLIIGIIVVAIFAYILYRYFKSGQDVNQIQSNDSNDNLIPDQIENGLRRLV